MSRWSLFTEFLFRGVALYGVLGECLAAVYSLLDQSRGMTYRAPSGRLPRLAPPMTHECLACFECPACPAHEAPPPPSPGPQEPPLATPRCGLASRHSPTGPPPGVTLSSQSPPHVHTYITHISHTYRCTPSPKCRPSGRHLGGEAAFR